MRVYNTLVSTIVKNVINLFLHCVRAYVIAENDFYPSLIKRLPKARIVPLRSELVNSIIFTC